MLIGVHKGDDDRQFATGIYQMRSLYALTAKKTRDRMGHGCSIYVFFVQIIEDFDVQRPMMPLVGLVEIDGDLNGHRVRHSTAPVRGPFPPIAAAMQSRLLARMLVVMSSHCPCSR